MLNILSLLVFQFSSKLFIFFLFFNYAFRPARKTLKGIKDIKKSWRIQVQLIKYQNGPPSDEKRVIFYKIFGGNCQI